jgi:hypothetical protein
MLWRAEAIESARGPSGPPVSLAAMLLNGSVK